MGFVIQMILGFLFFFIVRFKANGTPAGRARKWASWVGYAIFLVLCLTVNFVVFESPGTVVLRINEADDTYGTTIAAELGMTVGLLFVPVIVAAVVFGLSLLIQATPDYKDPSAPSDTKKEEIG